MTLNVIYRPAKPSDARAIVELLDMANFGAIRADWERETKSGETWFDFGEKVICQATHEIDLKSTMVAQCGEQVAGMLISFGLPPKISKAGLHKLPADVRAYMMLRAQVAGSYYLRDMAVFPEFRAHRIASHLLNDKIQTAYDKGYDLISAIVHETNVKLLAHYAKRGFQIVDRQLVKKHPLFDPKSQWFLLTLKKEDAVFIGADQHEAYQ